MNTSLDLGHELGPAIDDQDDVFQVAAADDIGVAATVKGLELGGHEVGGGDQRTEVGTVARMVQVAELADGRYAMICVGKKRTTRIGGRGRC